MIEKTLFQQLTTQLVGRDAYYERHWESTISGESAKKRIVKEKAMQRIDEGNSEEAGKIRQSQRLQILQYAMIKTKAFEPGKRGKLS